jgi:eukaryotic-like serine/threonine-protein kinase
VQDELNMSLKLTAESFITGVKQSGLADPEAIETLVKTLRGEGVDIGNSAALAAAMIDKGTITPWQSEKLLQGKFKGFILGRYKLLNLLGKGEMSSIYLAEHTRMKRRCAIKVLPANKVRDTSYLGRFHREAQAVAALDHNNIVRAYDVDTEAEGGVEIHFLVMEYVEGKDLEKLLETRQQFAVIEAADYLRQAAEGLAHAHEHGLVHRDIKPGNLLVDLKGVVKILDLGLARFFRDNETESLTIKHDEKVLGTADYLAPEQAVDSHAVDERADIYSLGCTLYFALTGHPPFTDGTLVQRLLAHQTKAPPSIRKQRPDVPESLVTIVEKMMQKRKDDRYQSASEVAAALSKWLVENGGQTWRQAHPALVARFAGLEAVQTRRPESDSKISRRAVDASAIPDRTSVERPSDPGKSRIGKGPRRPDASSLLTEPASRRREPAVAPVAAAPTVARDPEKSNPQWIVAPPSAPLVAPPLPAVVRTSPHNRIDRRFIYIAALVLGAVLLVAGVGYKLIASSDDEQPAPQKVVVPEGAGGLVNP